ncbi:MAG: YdaU family protein [Polaromonas sp.]|jgi:uncharacterized protein YdaU (DUF1376 family)
MKHYPHHISDFNNATRHLTRVERSLYRDLIELYYETEHPLPLDLSQVCRRIIANELSTDVERMLNEFFVQTPQGWYHVRCDEEITKYQGNNSQRAQAGKASAAKKALKKQQALNGKSTTVEIPFNENPTEIHNQSTNQPINQEPKERGERAKALSRPDDVGEQVWGDWVQLRKAKKATVTQTVVDHARGQAAIAEMTLEKFLSVWCARGSQGLEAEWLKPHERAGPQANTHKYAGAAKAIWGSNDESRIINA